MTPKQFVEILRKELRPIIEATVAPLLDKVLKPIIQTQNQHTKILESHSQLLEGHSQLLKSHSQLLEKHSRQLEDIIVELHQVHKLAEATSDVVKARYEKNKREIDEIKDHLGLPKEPYFGG